MRRSATAGTGRRAAARLAALALLWLGATSPAGAGVISIEFDLAGSTLTMLSGAIRVPPDGRIHSASVVVDLAGPGPATPTPGGPALLRSLAIDLSIDADVFGNLVTGSAVGAQVGSVPGTLSAGGLLLLLSQPLRLNLDARAGCSGDLCGVIADFPVSFSGTQTLAPVSAFGIGGVSLPGSATLAASLDLAIAAFSAELALMGAEVNRTFAPEPGSFGLVAVGLAALAVGGARRRRASRRPSRR